MAFFWFFFEEITVAINPVIERNGEHFYPFVFVDFYRFFAFQLVVDDFKTFVGFCDFENRVHHFFDAFRTVDIQWGFSSQKAERGNQSRQTETMVAVKMGNENMIDFGKPHFCFSHLNLCSFATIDEEMTFFHFQKLRSWRGIDGWNCGVESQNCKICTQFSWLY